MQKNEIESLIENVPMTISEIEAELGMPKTTLQKALKGDRGLPKKWAIKLRDRFGGIQLKAVNIDTVDGVQSKNVEINESAFCKVVTIESIRASCPPELKGIDRTIWIQEERKKYGL